RAKPAFAVTDTGPGQGGYIHYFIIEPPDGEAEVQIGIELPDGRIAWSFPGLGVVVSPFIKSGTMTANGKPYEVWHQYGLSPFQDDAAMLVLQKELAGRVAHWIERATPYCNTEARPDHLCMSCLGFVLRVLYPGRISDYPALPRSFVRAYSGKSYYTTEDFLLYLAGLHGIQGLEARLKRISGLALPESLREDLVRLATEADGAEAASPQPAPAKGCRSATRPGQQPAAKPKKL
ncbi:MAG: hypothetical protein HYV99_04735, partial [Betaproteobacteria bacterium]|nr:hypothetical protein [Betaproteobacteria bacterium]